MVAFYLCHNPSGDGARGTTGASSGSQRAVALELSQVGTIRDLDGAERSVQTGGFETGRDDPGQIREKAHRNPAGYSNQ